MRALALAALAAACAACAMPVPCTRALCPKRVEGSYRVTGWNGSVTVGPETPAVPVVSDAEVHVLSGEVEFTNNSAFIRASEGAVFSLLVSTASRPTPILHVSSGSVAVSQSLGVAFQNVPPGSSWLLPRAPKPK